MISATSQINNKDTNSQLLLHINSALAAGAPPAPACPRRGSPMSHRQECATCRTRGVPRHSDPIAAANI
eukprot:scaffold303_cov140-Isochrysis_galbana.AAC.6